MGSIIPLLVGGLSVCYSYFFLPLGRLTNPGPGLWPLSISTIIVLTSLILLATEGGEEYERFTSRVRLVSLGVVSMALFILFFAQIGFVIPGLLTLVFWLKFLGKEPWSLALAVAVLVVFGFYFLFGTLLQIPLPEGVFL